MKHLISPEEAEALANDFANDNSEVFRDGNSDKNKLYNLTIDVLEAANAKYAETVAVLDNVQAALEKLLLDADRLSENKPVRNLDETFSAAQAALIQLNELTK